MISDIAIVDFLDAPRVLQREVFKEMGFTLLGIRESDQTKRADIYLIDSDGKNHKWVMSKKNRPIVWGNN